MTPRIPGLLRSLVNLLLGALLPVLLAAPARADVQDIAAASRSVVRVALVATDGNNSYFVGHGSGVVVAPGRVLTNAHVVELARTEPNIVIGIIPSEGRKSYGGKVIAYSPGNDLALLAVEGAPTLPVATFLAGAPSDGDHVTAIGYPGAVDRAQGMNLADIIKPMSAVRTAGTVSAGRASKQFDTILHTAPLAAGNSGGPLVDDCGRVVGINSFGSLSDGGDAEYGFAVSDREIASFLRQADVQVQRSSEPCRSMAEIDAAQQLADERARAEAATQASKREMAQWERAIAAREQAQQQIIVKRENMMAIAALLLALGALAGGAALLARTGGKAEQARKYGIAAGLLLLGAIIIFVLKPGFAGTGTATAPHEETAANAMADAAAPGTVAGDRLCRLDNALSRVTVSDTRDVSFSWNADGCLNGQTQFLKAADTWSRILVPADENSISLRQFDPRTGRYRTDKYLVDAATIERARALRERVGWSGCTADPARLAELAAMQRDIQATLPAKPNERLIYQCDSGAAPETGPAQ